MDKQYYVYIMTNNSGTLYIGMTNDLQRRIAEHKAGINPGFTQKYKTKKLIYYEMFNYANEAIAREKQLKGWVRRRKIALIEVHNPGWVDLADGWGL